MVAGVSPKKAGSTILGLPIFKTVAEAKEFTKCDATVIYNPPETAAKAMIEAIEAEVRLIVCSTQNVPQLDAARVRAAFRSQRESRLIGPGSPGIIKPDECLIGTMIGNVFIPGCVAIVSRSTSLAHEAAYQTSECGLGQTICIGIGSDPFHGMGYIECLEKILQDKKTKGNFI